MQPTQERKEKPLPERNDESPTYTRRQAVADGQLVDVTDLARRVLRDVAIPIAMTDTVLKVVSPHGTRKATVERRMRELLHAATTAVLSRLPELGRSPFEVQFGRRIMNLVIEFHEADEGGLVGTIMVEHAGRDRG